MGIVLLQASNNHPAYTIHLGNKSEKEVDVKIRACAQRAFQLLGIFCVSLKDSACRNLGSAGTSFKYIVLGYYGPLRKFQPPQDIYLAVFKVVFWVAMMGWGIVATTCCPSFYPKSHKRCA